MSRTTTLLLATLCTLVAAPSTAVAQRDDVRFAEPSLRDGDRASLSLADERDGSLCVRVSEREVEGDFSSGGGSSCQPAPKGLDRPPIVVGSARHVGGIVPVEGTRVEAFFAGVDAPVTAQTAPPAPYAGRARARVRVFLLAAPATPPRPGPHRGDSLEPYAVRVLDDAGRLVALFDDAEARVPDRGPIRLARVRSSRAVATVTAERRSQLAGTPADPERREAAACVRTESGNGSSSFCAQPSGGEFVTYSGSCRPHPITTLVAFVRAGTTSADLVLGDGRRRAARVAELTARLGVPAAVVVGVAPAGVAVRAIEVTGPDGARRTVPVALAPAPFSCELFGPGAPFPGRPAAAPAVALAGPPVALAATPTHRLLVADAADGRLCAALDWSPGTETDCGVPSREPRFTAVSVAPEDGTVFATVPARVATAEVVLSDATTRRVAAAPAGPYTGIYARSTRFVVFTPPAGAVVTGVRLLDADDRFLGASSIFRRFPFLRPARRIAVLPGGIRLWDVVVAVPGRTTMPRIERQRRACLVIGPGVPRDDESCRAIEPSYSSTTFVGVKVACTTRRPVVFAALGREATGLRVRLAGGAVRRARIVRAPTGRVAVAVLRPRDRLVGIAVTGPSAAKQARPLPAGASQCGYTGFAFLSPNRPVGAQPVR